MKLITSAAAIALGLSFVTPSTAQTRDDIRYIVGTCNEHGWIKEWADGTYLAIGISGDFITNIYDDKEIKGRWAKVSKFTGAASIPVPYGPMYVFAACSDRQLRFDPNYRKHW